MAILLIQKAQINAEQSVQRAIRRGHWAAIGERDTMNVYCGRVNCEAGTIGGVARIFAAMA